MQKRSVSQAIAFVGLLVTLAIAYALERWNRSNWPEPWHLLLAAVPWLVLYWLVTRKLEKSALVDWTFVIIGSALTFYVTIKPWLVLLPPSWLDQRLYYWGLGIETPNALLLYSSVGIACLGIRGIVSSRHAPGLFPGLNKWEIVALALVFVLVLSITWYGIRQDHHLERWLHWRLQPLRSFAVPFSVMTWTAIISLARLVFDRRSGVSRWGYLACAWQLPLPLLVTFVSPAFFNFYFVGAGFFVHAAIGVIATARSLWRKQDFGDVLALFVNLVWSHLLCWYTRELIETFWD